MSLNDPYSDFNITPLFDAEYLRNGTRYRHSLNVIPIGTYTRPILKGVISYDLETGSARRLSATAEFLVDYSAIMSTNSGASFPNLQLDTCLSLTIDAERSVVNTH